MKVSRMENMISNMSFTTAYHHLKLITRTVFLVMVIADHFICRAHNVDYFSTDGLHTSFFAMAIWVLFMMEMVLRLLPSKLESNGCQKQFQSMYKPGKGKPIAGTARSGRKITALVWILINLPFALLYYYGVLRQSGLMILAMVYAVYAMMFTPLILVRTWFSWSLIGMALFVVLVWEYRLWRFPERFSAETNLNLSCANCTEKLCKSKKQLQGFIVRLEKEYRIKDIRKQIGIDNRFDRDEEQPCD